MKKTFTRIAVVLLASSAVLPVTACTFNFYVNSATNAVIDDFANQTSSFVKGLVLSKEKNSDTASSITDIFNNSGGTPNNSSIYDKTPWTVTSWSQLAQAWGLNGSINTTGFNPVTDQYFVATGQGSLTKTMNSYDSIDNALGLIGNVQILASADNRTVYNALSGNEQMFINFLEPIRQAQTPAQAGTLGTILKNLIIGNDWQNPAGDDNFTNVLIKPFTQMTNYLINGAWDDSTPTTPANISDFKTYMQNWKDAGGNYYAQGISVGGGTWNEGLVPTTGWDQTDFNLYRSIALVNHLFFQIGKDYQIKKPSSTGPYVDRYLGAILSDHFSLSSPYIDINGLLADVEQYLPYLLQSPANIMDLIQAVIPIIKTFILDTNNAQLVAGIKNLGLGSIFPTNKDTGTYNVLDVLQDIIDLLNNPNKIKTILEAAFGIQQIHGRSLLADIIIHFIFNANIPNLITVAEALIPSIKTTVDDLIKQATDFVTGPTIKGVLTGVLSTYKEWIKQYDNKSDGINFDLTKFQTFLLDQQKGLLYVLQTGIVKELHQLFVGTNPITATQVYDIFTSLGGQLPPTPSDQAPQDFVADSALDALKRAMIDPNNGISQIITILAGKTDSYTGISNVIRQHHQDFEENNYRKYFDTKNQRIGQISQGKMTTTISGGQLISKLSYRLVYQIDNETYTFDIKCQSKDSSDNFSGVKNFFFTDINLRSIIVS